MIIFFVLSVTANIQEMFTGWCNNCEQPKVVPIIQEKLKVQFPNPAKCGNNICEWGLLENCLNCPQDCQCSDTAKSCKNSKHVALTFDDGPSEFTPELLDILKMENISASFFVIGKNLNNKNHDVLKRIHEEGHLIGQHTYDHMSLKSGSFSGGVSGTASISKVTAQLLVSDKLISDIIGLSPRAYRPPFLENSEESRAQASSMGFLEILLNADSNDWRNVADVESKKITEVQASQNVFRELTQNMESAQKTGAGIITLQHDSRLFSVRAVKAIISETRRKGLLFVPLYECLGLQKSNLYRETSQQKSQETTKQTSQVSSSSRLIPLLFLSLLA